MLTCFLAVSEPYWMTQATSGRAAHEIPSAVRVEASSEADWGRLGATHEKNAPRKRFDTYSRRCEQVPVP